MGFSTTSVARACSRRPGRTFAAWGLVLLGSFAALAFALTGFTTQSSPTNNPQSERAHDRLVAAFPTDPQHTVTVADSAPVATTLIIVATTIYYPVPTPNRATPLPLCRQPLVEFCLL
jgi:hypothetical protein